MPVSYSAGAVTTVRTDTIASDQHSKPQTAMALTIGTGEPSKNGELAITTAPPASICSVPPSDDAKPARSP